MNIFLLELYPGSVEKTLEQHFENQEGEMQCTENKSELFRTCRKVKV